MNPERAPQPPIDPAELEAQRGNVVPVSPEQQHPAEAGPDTFRARLYMGVATKLAGLSERAEGAAYRASETRAADTTEHTPSGRETVSNAVEKGRQLGRKIGTFFKRDISRKSNEGADERKSFLSYVREKGGEKSVEIKGYFTARAEKAEQNKADRREANAARLAAKGDKPSISDAIRDKLQYAKDLPSGLKEYNDVRKDKTAKAAEKAKTERYEKQAAKATTQREKTQAAADKAALKTERLKAHDRNKLEKKIARKDKYIRNQVEKYEKNQIKRTARAEAIQASKDSLRGTIVNTAESLRSRKDDVKRVGKTALSGVAAGVTYVGNVPAGVREYSEVRKARDAREADKAKTVAYQKAREQYTRDQEKVQAKAAKAAAKAQSRYDSRTTG